MSLIPFPQINNLEFEQYKFRPIGKLFLTSDFSLKNEILTVFLVIEAKNLKGIGNNTTIFIRLKHTPYVLRTKKVLSSDSPKWKQSFLM